MKKEAAFERKTVLIRIKSNKQIEQEKEKQQQQTKQQRQPTEVFYGK